MKKMIKTLMAVAMIFSMTMISVPVMADELKDQFEDFVPMEAGTPELSILNGGLYTVEAGKVNEIKVKLRNTGGWGAYDISVIPQYVDLDNTPFTIAYPEGQGKIFNIPANGERTLTFLVDVTEIAPAKTYEIKLAISQFNSDDVKSESDKSIYIKVTNSLGSYSYDLTDYVTDPVEIEDGGSGTIGATLRNLSTIDMMNVVVKLGGLEPDGISVKGSNMVKYNKIEKGTFKTFTFNVFAADGMETGNYPVTYTVSYQDEAGNKYSEEYSHYVGVKGDGTGNEDDSASKPKIIVSKYESDPLIVMAGEEFDLNLEFMNTNASKSVKNIKMYLTLFEETSSDSAKTGNIFTPVNSSNTFYFDSIAPKGTAEKTIRLYTVPDAQPKTYTLTVNFEYEDANGKEYTATELLGINVKQPTEIELGEIYIPEMLEVGGYVGLSFELYNTGKVSVNNLMIKLEGDIDTSTKSVYYGSFESGSTQWYDNGFSILNEGPNNVKFIVSYDDPSGEHIEDVREYVIEGTAPFIPEDMMMEEPLEPETNNTTKYIGTAAVCLVMVVFVIVFIKKSKNTGKADEAEKMAADEEE